MKNHRNATNDKFIEMEGPREPRDTKSSRNDTGNLPKIITELFPESKKTQQQKWPQLPLHCTCSMNDLLHGTVANTKTYKMTTVTSALNSLHSTVAKTKTYKMTAVTSALNSRWRVRPNA